MQYRVISNPVNSNFLFFLFTFSLACCTINWLGSVISALRWNQSSATLQDNQKKRIHNRAVARMKFLRNFESTRQLSFISSLEFCIKSTLIKLDILIYLGACWISFSVTTSECSFSRPPSSPEHIIIRALTKPVLTLRILVSLLGFRASKLFLSKSST